MSDRADIDSPLRDTDPLLWNALRAANLFDSIDISVLEDGASRWQALMAGKRLAKFIQREYPADDDEPITSEWLESIGSVKVLSDRWHGFYNGDGIEVSFFRPNETVPYELTIGHQFTVEAKTRGDFRRVCKVMKIVLKEAPRH